MIPNAIIRAKNDAVKRGAFFLEAPCFGMKVGMPCDKSYGRTFRVYFRTASPKHGLEIHVFACACTEWEYRGELWRIPGDLLEEQYADMVNHVTKHEAFHNCAGRTFYWKVCPCGRETNHEWAYDLTCSYPIAAEWYCSFECYARDHNLICAECGGVLKTYSFDCPEMNRSRDELRVATFRILSKGIRWKYAREVAHCSDKNYCSPECCSLALERLKQIEREERQHRKEMQCVRNVGKLMSAARRSLREQDRDAWKWLKKEFAREATSRQ